MTEEIKEFKYELKLTEDEINDLMLSLNCLKRESKDYKFKHDRACDLLDKVEREYFNKNS